MVYHSVIVYIRQKNEMIMIIFDSIIHIIDDYENWGIIGWEIEPFVVDCSDRWLTMAEYESPEKCIDWSMYCTYTTPQ